MKKSWLVIALLAAVLALFYFFYLRRPAGEFGAAASPKNYMAVNPAAEVSGQTPSLDISRTNPFQRVKLNPFD